MVEIEFELQKLQESIKLYQRMLEILNIRLFYISNKQFKSEYDENENELKLVKTNHQIGTINTRLSYLIADYNTSFELYKHIENEARK